MLLRLKFAALAGAVASLVSFSAASAIVVEWTVASGGNGHFYEFVGGPFTFEDARAAALNRSHNGLDGYLVTITSQAEDTFVRAIPGDQGWAGGSDGAVEGSWRWLDGPEAGTLFWQNGTTVTYAAWNANEPNNFRGDEDFLLIRFNQAQGWNDQGFSQQGYYVEYSAAPLGGIPEPATWAMMLGGFAMAGAAIRGRRPSARSSRLNPVR